MAEKQGSIVQTVSGYAYSLEQTLFHWTYAIFGASMGFIQGGFHATQRLQPHFTSTHGLKELIVGSNHVHEPQAQGTITDLLKSWVPNFSSSKSKTIGGPVSHSKTNGYALPKETALQTDPSQAPEKPLTAKARDFTPRSMYEHYKGGNAAGGDEPALAPGTRTQSYETEPHHSHGQSSDAETFETDDDDHSAMDPEDPNYHRKRKKAKEAVKKVGHAIKTVFKIPIENSDKAHGGIIGSCTHPATK